MLPTAPAGQASLADVLAIERRTWRTRGAKAEAIDRLGMTEIDTPEALRSDPALVNRLRERRVRRLARRNGQEGP
jgi:hypothetical protein